MKSYNIIVLPGDGIGPEVINQAVKVLTTCAELFSFQIELNYDWIGAAAITHTGETITENTLKKYEKADAILLGTFDDSTADRDINIKNQNEKGLLNLHHFLGLFAKIRPIKIHQQLLVKSPLKSKIIKGTDMIIYQEMSESIQFIPEKKNQNSPSELSEYSIKKIERIGHLAFQTAQKRKHTICLMENANFFEISTHWKNVIEKLSKQYPDVQLKHLDIDQAAIQLLVNPLQFDVILTSNMFDNKLTGLVHEISGSIELLAAISTGNSTTIFQPSHSAFPEIKGMDKGNPMAAILSVALMLEHLGENAAAKLINDAIAWCIEEELTTLDINNQNPLSCAMVGDMIDLFIAKNGTIDFDVKSINRDIFYI
ncbi:3-isopropylmalate dehydrogenase [Putridiphycobacter roseus]|uniref:3-isopropylmalate dehydrogenase n=1 Tax=Putridiphycobacter roseus TaxID=2219161 RepID=A0A2W1MX83_9FLAO|nr:isocitrate/isopropylmalate family dehydrogenase [Putridiphycobacter roseus]PZE15770.1 3-isopropylmalate dehydrogenase [Putridiphycobacter roseus]